MATKMHKRHKEGKMMRSVVVPPKNSSIPFVPLCGHPSIGNRQSSKGFTLVEMLVVITILILLGGLFLGPLSIARRQAKVKATDSNITLLKSALERYENDFQDYPPSDGDNEGMKGATNLYGCLKT